jgi:fructosamine-3-kinase
VPVPRREAVPWQPIAAAIGAATGEPFTPTHSDTLSGGDCSNALRLADGHRRYFVKWGAASQLPAFEAEADALDAMAATRSVRVPEAICSGADGGHAWLVTRYIAFTPAAPATAARLGEELAGLHRASADAFGWHRDNVIGRTPQLNDWHPLWPVFFARRRLAPQLQWAHDNGADPTLLERGRRLLEKMPAFFSTYQPSPALLHGDLWGGNWAADERGAPVLFDPATYYGDRETDLAMSELFGGFGPDFYAAYRACWPLDTGYATRKSLYNLYHLLNHFNLFGGGYARRAAMTVERLLALA